MKKILGSIIYITTIGFLFSACTKVDNKNLYTPIVVAAKPFAPISDSTCLSGPLNGTLLAGKTYHACGNIIVNAGDTLIIQEGVTLKFQGNYGIGVSGSLFCLGTQANPNLITYDSTITRTDVIGANPSTDPAYRGLWSGIVGSNSCPYMIIKWTHIEFGGGVASGKVAVLYSGSDYPIFFQNPNGIFVLEDSWLYGSVDDPIRILGGKVAILRNTFEKCGYNSGESMNVKAGTIGNFAYNLSVGSATNAHKVSNSGVINGVPGSNVRIYNNTIINCGYRRASAGRGGSVDFEQSAGGYAYNNIMVNCKFGIRVVQNPIADTANTRYGYNLNYGDSASVVNNFIPSLSISTAITQPQSTDIPNDFSFLPLGWGVGQAYVAPLSFIGANNPQFINGPVPLPVGANLRDISFVGSYNFRLKPTSPCIGKGYTGFAPRTDVPVDPKYGVTELTPPGIDLGAYQFDGTGNQH